MVIIGIVRNRTYLDKRRRLQPPSEKGSCSIFGRSADHSAVTITKDRRQIDFRSKIGPSASTLRVRRRTTFLVPQYCWNLYPSLKFHLAARVQYFARLIANIDFLSPRSHPTSVELKRTRTNPGGNLGTLNKMIDIDRNGLSRMSSNPIDSLNKSYGSMPLSGDANYSKNNSSPPPSDQTKRHSTRRWIKIVSIASLCLLILAL